MRLMTVSHFFLPQTGTDTPTHLGRHPIPRIAPGVFPIPVKQAGVYPRPDYVP